MRNLVKVVAQTFYSALFFKIIQSMLIFSYNHELLISSTKYMNT